MLSYSCLVLDHDDTVVQSEETINYPFFCQILDHFRPGTRISLDEYIQGCFFPGFSQMCRDRFGFTQQELQEEYSGWMDYVKTHIPAPFPGIKKIIRRYKQAGGILCVVSHSSQVNIARDYAAHFGIQPDEIFGWDYPEHQRKPSPYPLEQIMHKYRLSPHDMLVIDDMRPAYERCRAAGVSIGFAGWGRKKFPAITKEMSEICDFSFFSTSELESFLFTPAKSEAIDSTPQQP